MTQPKTPAQAGVFIPGGGGKSRKREVCTQKFSSIIFVVGRGIPLLTCQERLMKHIAFVFSAMMLPASIASAADDPIAARKALMDANGAAAAVAAALMKGEVDYNPAVAKAAIMTFRAVGHTYGAFFPEGSDKGETKASPKIWQDRAGFEKELGEFRERAEAAAKAAGKNGPADLAAFKKAVTPIFDECQDCHESYRLK